MARSWLQVMTGEVQAKREARERLDEQRASNHGIVSACLADVVRPGLQAAADACGWSLEENDAGPGEPARCRIVAPGIKPAYAEVSIDAVNLIAVLRRHPGGAGANAETTALRCAALDRESLDAWLKPLTG